LFFHGEQWLATTAGIILAYFGLFPGIMLVVLLTLFRRSKPE